ncbi:MAG: hypothetical protein ACI8S6_002296 [Myxococcota bacterium]|jgi:hypothetical protein
MIALALLLGFAPTDDVVPVGPPLPRLDRSPQLQARRSAQADWRQFRQERGEWQVRWDSRNDTPRFLLAPGTPLDELDGVVADVARLARVPVRELTLLEVVTRGPRTFHVYRRSWRGATVEGDELLVISRDGRIVGIQAQLTPIRIQQPPLPGELVFVGADGHAQLARRTVEGPEVVYTDRGGQEVYRHDTRLFGDVRVSHEARTIGDEIVESPARNIIVEDSSGVTEQTGADGQHGLTGTIAATLTGPELSVLVADREVSLVGGEDLLFVGGEDMPLSAGTVQHHFHVVWDWLKLRWPDHPWLDEQVRATVEARSGTCNAFYTGGTINFLPDDPENCNNFGQIADVVYHEVGHGIHDYIRVAGTFAGDVSEGSADYISATILDDPVLAPNARLDGGYIREIETDRVYPDDITGEVHNDGLIWASFLWNLRADWQTMYGAEDGAEMADHILLGALELGPTLSDIYEAVLLADDDDADVTNGTPHDCELIGLLNQHGIGPGSTGFLTFDHEPLGTQASATEGYPVTFDVSTWPDRCAAFDEDSVTLYYTVDLGEGEWTLLPLDTDGLTWAGTLPRQPASTEVRYYLSASSVDGTEEVTTHGGREEALYRFRVGDREPLFCEGFEHGADGWSHASGLPGDKEPDESIDDWAVGTPTGADGDPADAYAGQSVAATNLDGKYAPNNRSYLQSPVWTVDDPGPMFMLSYQRHLAVEDALYDHANILINGELLWENPGSKSGTDAHLVDAGWTLHDLPLDGGGDIQLTWTLESDGGLEYGGWALDEVCLVQLADIPGHYRTGDLVASDEAGPVELTWTQPWVTPLHATVLVRSRDGWPEGPGDGVIIDADLAPVPGEERSATDTDAEPGEVFYYALFAAGEDEDDWYTETVEGENADIGGVVADDGDTGSTAVVESEGCGCGDRRGRAVLILPLLLGFSMVRRRGYSSRK